MARIRYLNEKTVEEPELGLSLLEISLKHGIDHTHACGGHGRCSTCRVLILKGLRNVLPRNEVEAALARKKGFEDDVRLACQCRLTGPVTLRRLVRDAADVKSAVSQGGRSTGREQAVAVLFCDIRDFTSFAETQLPYDVVHVLNRFFQEMGDAILRHGGRIDKFMGDGVMALFGTDGGAPRTVCADAVRAGLDMQDGLRGLNGYLTETLGTTFRIGIGVHFGEAIVGEMGHSSKTQFTAIGDAVNVASRVEGATKTAKAALLVSEAVHSLLAKELVTGKEVTTALKGKTGAFRLYEALGFKD